MALEEARVYPTGWTGAHEQREYVVDAYQRLVQFIADARDAGDALLLYLD